MNSPQKQSGDVLALVLVVVVAALVVMSGWIAVDQTVNRDKSSNHDHSGHAEDEWLEDELDETEDWLKIETEQFSMRVPDGWELNRVDSGSGVSFSAACLSQECLTYQPGKTAVITEVGGSDSWKPFFVTAYPVDEWDDSRVSEFRDLGGIKSLGGVGQKYSRLYEAGESVGLGAAEANTQEYVYVFKHDDVVLYASYHFMQGERDNSRTAERAVRTLKLN